MDEKEKELLSMHYQIEKTDIKQQKLEDRIMSISEDLRKSKNIRNLYFVFIIVLILFMVFGGFYLDNNIMGFGYESEDVKSSGEVEQLIRSNDSLQNEINILKSDMLKYKEKAALVSEEPVSEGNERYSTLETVKESVIINRDTTSAMRATPPKYKRIHGYVNRIYESNETIFAEVDVIEFYRGKRAVQKAKEMGEAEYDIDKKGDTLYFLYNNYYISNQNSKTRIFELDDKARVKVENINQISDGFSLKAFQRIIADKPVLILETNNGIIYKITQQKLP